MANNVAVLNKQKYTKMVQALLEEQLIAMDLANTMLLDRMPDGNVINYPRAEFQNVMQYTKYTDVTDQDIDLTNETLIINRTPIITFVYDDVDNLDNGYDVVASAAPKAAYRIKQDIEGNFFNEYSNFKNRNGTATTLTVGANSNVTETYGKAYATLANDGVNTANLVSCIDPFQMERIGTGSLGNTFNVADKAYKKGFRGTFQNMSIAVCTNLTATSSLNMATQPTANNTVTIGGVTFKFVTTLSNPGDVLRGASVADSRANLIAAVNGAAGAGSTYTELTSANRSKMEGLSLTQGSGSTINFESKRGYKVLSQTLTAAADKWAAVIIHNIIMEKGAIHLVMQKEVSLKIQDVHKQLGTRYMTWARYGIKTFEEGAERGFDLEIVAQDAE